MAVSDPLLRLTRQEHRLDNLDLPALLEMLFRELPLSVSKENHDASQRRKGHRRSNAASTKLERIYQPN